MDVSGGQLESSGGVWVVRVGGQVGGAGCIGGVECTLCQRRNGMLVIVSNGCWCGRGVMASSIGAFEEA